jgi:hypothetical protein
VFALDTNGKVLTSATGLANTWHETTRDACLRECAFCARDCVGWGWAGSRRGGGWWGAAIGCAAGSFTSDHCWECVREIVGRIEKQDGRGSPGTRGSESSRSPSGPRERSERNGGISVGRDLGGGIPK